MNLLVGQITTNVPLNDLVQRLGWTLVHSLWQYAVIALFAMVAIRLMVRSSASARYEHLLSWKPGDAFDYLEMSVALRIAGHRRSPSDWQFVTQLRNNPNPQVQSAIVDAAVGWKTDESMDLLRDKTDAFGYAAWELIRCGDVAIPRIVSIIQNSAGRPRDMKYERMFRAYLTHWDKLPAPVDQRIVDAVTR